jgi:DUF1365 family protein
MTFASGLYEGVVSHARLWPRQHRLAYRIFQMLIDLDELPRLDRSLRLFGHNRPGLLSFHDKDHGPGDGRPLRPWIEAELARAGIGLDGGAIRLLSMPRVLGQAFNPISLWFCHRRSGELAAILYEVNNTFGERHSYLIPVADGQRSRVRQACDKVFHVSPFMDMQLRYSFLIRPPGGDVLVGVTTSDAEGPVLLASFAGKRQAISDRAILGAFLRHPLLAAKVLVAIHWEALKLWLKGLRLRPGAPAPEDAVTIVRSPQCGSRGAGSVMAGGSLAGKLSSSASSSSSSSCSRSSGGGLGLVGMDRLRA